MGHQTDYPRRRRRQFGQAVAAHARVELEVDAYAFRNFGIADRQLEAGFACLRDLAVRARRTQDDDACSRVVAPQLQALGNRGDAERSRPGADRCARGVCCAMSVTVRLHDRPEL